MRRKRSRTKRIPVSTLIFAFLALAIIAAIVAGAVLVVDDADEKIEPPNFTPRLLPAIDEPVGAVG